MKFLSLDIESTGLDTTATEAMILSVGMIVDDLENQEPYEVLPKIHIKLDASQGNIVGNLFAINMNSELLKNIQCLSQAVKADGGPRKHGGMLLQETVCYPNSLLENINATEYFTGYDRASRLICEFLNENFLLSYPIVVAGKNVGSFDVPFLLSQFPQLQQEIRFNHAVMDPAILYMLPSDFKVPSLSLCKERAGFADVEVAHTALADAWDVCRLLRTKFPKEIK